MILIFTQFYALLISLPFALSNSRSEIHRGHERAGTAMIAGIMLNAVKQRRGSR